MAVMCFADDRGQGWIVDFDQVSQIFYSDAFAELKWQRKNRVEDQRHFGLNLVRIEINYHNFRADVRASALRKFRQFRRLLIRDGNQALEHLIGTRENAKARTTQLIDLQRQADRETSAALGTQEAIGQFSTDALRHVMDCSRGFLKIATAIVPMDPATLAGFAAAVGYMDGVAQYQDSGSVGTAAIVGTSSFTFGLIPAARAATGATSLAGREALALLVVKAKLEFGRNVAVSLASGHDTRTALIEGMTAAGLGAVADYLGDNFFNSLSVPAQVIANAVTNQVSDEASAAVSESLDQVELSRDGGAASPSFGLSQPRQHGELNAREYVQQFALRPASANNARRSA